MENRHAGSTDQRLLDVAAELVAARGVRGLTVAELARSAGVSRPTVYRRYPGAEDVVRALLAHRVQKVINQVGPRAADRAGIVAKVLAFGDLLHEDPIFRRLLEREPDVFTEYTFRRIGRSQRVILEWLASAITAAQAGGTVRGGSPADLAVMVLLVSQSAVLSHGTVQALVDDAAWRAELTHVLDAYLRPAA